MFLNQSFLLLYKADEMALPSKSGINWKEVRSNWQSEQKRNQKDLVQLIRSAEKSKDAYIVLNEGEQKYR